MSDRSICYFHQNHDKDVQNPFYYGKDCDMIYINTTQETI